MSSMDLVLSEKYKAFLKCQTPVEFLEGTTAAGKTTVGIFKFMLKVAQSPKKLHILAADDTGTAEKNIINKDLGILDDFGSLVEYNGSGTKDDKIPHILFILHPGTKPYTFWDMETRRNGRKPLAVSMDACTSMRSTRQILTLSVKLPCAVIISWQP